MPKIFISYGRDESYGQNLATEAQQQLQSAGFEVFRDVIGLKPGDVWYSKLEFELDSSDLVVLIVSEKVRTSDWVHNEVSMAREIGLPIIPVIAEQVRMPLWLRHLQALDFSEQENWSALFSSISGHVGIPEVLATKNTSEKQTNNADSQQVQPPKVAKQKKPASTAKTVATRKSATLKPSQSNHSEPSWATHSGKDQYGQYADLEVNKVTQRFRLIHPGTFQMGSPESEKERFDNETLHQVTLSEALWLADTACTQALWLAVMGNNPSHFTDNKNNPVEQVSWDDIQEFIQTLSQLKPGVTFQLPTEAQWEYACRAETTTPFSFGENMTSEQINYNGEYPYKKGLFRKKDLNRGKTLAVRSFPTNQWGLYEMHGNVWEWCRDAYSELSSEACTDPYNPSGDYRVLRGGSWFYNGGRCRSAYRGNFRPDYRDDGIVGFRFALVN